MAGLAKASGVRLDWLAYNIGPMRHVAPALTPAQREMVSAFNHYRRVIAAGMPHTSALMQYVDDYNVKLATVSPIDGIDRVTIDALSSWIEMAAEEVARRPATVLDSTVLRDVIQTVEEFLAERGLALEPAKKAELLVLIYEDIRDHDGKVDRTRVLRLVNLAA